MNVPGFIRRIAEGLFSKAPVSSKMQAVLGCAQEEAHRMNHNFVGTEHLLLAMLHAESNMALSVMKQMVISPLAVCYKIERFVGFGEEGIKATTPYTPMTKRALALAGREAKTVGSAYVGTQHLLLGLLRVHGVAALVLKDFNVGIEAVRKNVIQLAASWVREE